MRLAGLMVACAALAGCGDGAGAVDVTVTSAGSVCGVDRVRLTVSQGGALSLPAEYPVLNSPATITAATPITVTANFDKDHTGDSLIRVDALDAAGALLATQVGAAHVEAGKHSVAVVTLPGQDGCGRDSGVGGADLAGPPPDAAARDLSIETNPIDLAVMGDIGAPDFAMSDQGGGGPSPDFGIGPPDLWLPMDLAELPDLAGAGPPVIYSGGCITSKDCKAGVCDVQKHACIECLATADCPMGTACLSGQCQPAMRCVSSVECKVQNRICSATVGACVDCDEDADCGGADGTCLDHVCYGKRQCISDKDCPAVCDKGGSHLCVECVVDLDCPKNEYCSPDHRCLADVCASDTCAAGQILLCAANGSTYTIGSCDDKNVCTDDTCNAGACKHTNNAINYDDWQGCTTGVCAGGVYMPMTAIPSSEFTWDQQAPITGQLVTFTPAVMGSAYDWTFSAGTPANSAAVKPGTTWYTAKGGVGKQTVTLSATANGCNTKTTHAINVAQAAPYNAGQCVLAQGYNIPYGNVAGNCASYCATFNHALQNVSYTQSRMDTSTCGCNLRFSDCYWENFYGCGGGCGPPQLWVWGTVACNCVP